MGILYQSVESGLIYLMFFIHLPEFAIDPRGCLQFKFVFVAGYPEERGPVSLSSYIISRNMS
jgi:hypothetical protein